MGLLKRLASTFLGNVVIFQLMFSLPLFLALWLQNYADWTVAWTVYALFLSLVGGALSGGMFWCVATRPLLKRRQSQR
jgi:hypothetical protein